MDESKNYLRLKEYTLNLGASLFGVADLGLLRGDFAHLSPKITRELKYGISLAVRLSNKIIEEIEDRPTRLYFHHYRQVNLLLDQIALKLSGFIQSQGWGALSIPASQIIDWKKQEGHLSHKAVAAAAGLGWVGRNNLLVSPDFGSRTRLVTILTDMPLSPNKPLNRDCGDCGDCLFVCPAGAIKKKREEFDHLACFEQLRLFRKKCNIGHYICGICVKACPGKS